jgi:hypothetical protein
MKKLKLLWELLLPIIKNLFSRNRYVNPIWIFVFDTVQAQIISVQEYMNRVWSLNLQQIGGGGGGIPDQQNEKNIKKKEKEVTGVAWGKEQSKLMRKIL